MKRLVALLILILAVPLPSARAQQGADDQYIIIYTLTQQADSLDSTGQLQQALAQYVQVQDELQKFQKNYPDWNPRIVSFRLNYLAEKIAEVTAKLSVVLQSGALPGTVPAPPAPGAAPSTSAADLEAQLGALHEQVQQLQADNTTLQAKLKEALGAQPAAVDPRELSRARETIRSLMKENDLLKVSLARGKTGTTPGGAGAELDALKLAELALVAANQKLAEQTARASNLDRENQAVLAGPEGMAASREENALLKKHLGDLKPAAPDAAEAARLNAELAGARKQIAALQSAADVGFLEKTALENRVRQLQIAAVNSAPVAPPSSPAENEARIRALTQERNDLLAKLGEANQKLYGRRKQDAVARINVLTDEVNALRARLAVDEAQIVPYTPEELALFKQPAPQLARNPEKKPIKELPGGSAQLVAEAQHYFSARQFDKAEDDYQKILQRDENNGLVLANLATIEMEQGKLDDAEKHITAAVAQSPNDAYNLSILGYLKFRQEKFDDALDALSRAAKLDPRNPEIENYLGVTLGHKGLRAQAETALRKAIQLDPNYGPAHNNLAVIYISQLPPLVELARWHYQKALDAGQPHNPDLEKMLDAKDAPANPQ
jgi:Tfp pilus assembly protein PilF